MQCPRRDHDWPGNYLQCLPLENVGDDVIDDLMLSKHLMRPYLFFGASHPGHILFYKAYILHVRYLVALNLPRPSGEIQTMPRQQQVSIQTMLFSEICNHVKPTKQRFSTNHSLIDHATEIRI